MKTMSRADILDTCAKYEAPLTPDICIKTEKQTLDSIANQILTYIKERGLIGEDV